MVVSQLFPPFDGSGAGTTTQMQYNNIQLADVPLEEFG
jgi:hypothetical protein